MKRRAGFTLIELLITISVMVILLTLTVVSLRSSQANARDEERKTDVTTISQQIETYYESGTDSSGASVTGEYPSTNIMNTETLVKQTLRDIDPNALRDPSTPAASPISFIVASNNSVPTLASLNSGATYIYQPLDASGALCTTAAQECRKFNLFYTLETNATVQSIVSRHQ